MNFIVGSQRWIFAWFEPESMSTQIIARILIKSLMAMPAPGFSLCLILIPERVNGMASVEHKKAKENVLRLFEEWQREQEERHRQILELQKEIDRRARGRLWSW